MINHVLVVFLIIHFTGGFYLQRDKELYAKTSGIKELILSSIAYLALMFVPFIFYGANFWYLLIGVIAAMSRGLIRYIKYIIIKNKDTLADNPWIYLCEQLMEIGIILIAVILFSEKQTMLLFTSTYAFSRRYITYLKWVLLLIMSFKTANVTFKIIFNRYKPDESKNEASNRAGATIGNFERLLYNVCIALKQYTLIGLIITCKGFARYKDIQEKQGFAEYFLIGTFYSLVYTIISHYLIFHVIP